MRFDSHASFLAHTCTSPCLSREPKAKVATLRVIEQLEVKVILKELNLDSIDITKVITLPIINEKEEDK
jgi:hypothetical protein